MERVGGPERDKEQPCPTPHVRVLLFLLSRTVLNSGAPRREGGSCARPVGICLFRVRKGGRVRDAGWIRDAHFRASPLREALPYLSHRSPPPPSPTCILKPLVVLGLAQAASSGRRNLNRGLGGRRVQGSAVGRYHLCSLPARAPPFPHTPEPAQSDLWEGGTVARTRLWQGARRVGAPRRGTSGACRASDRLPFGGGAQLRRPAPSPPGVGGAAGAPGAGPGAGLRLLRPSPESPGTAAADAATVPVPQP